MPLNLIELPHYRRRAISAATAATFPSSLVIGVAITIPMFFIELTPVMEPGETLASVKPLALGNLIFINLGHTVAANGFLQGISGEAQAPNHRNSLGVVVATTDIRRTLILTMTPIADRQNVYLGPLN